MIYILGGSGRAGKTTISKILHDEYGIEGLSGDLLRGLIERAQPELGISHKETSDNNAERMWPWIEALVDYRKYFDKSFLYEGDALKPELCSTLLTNPKVKVAFIGIPDADVETKLRHIRDYPSDGEWTAKKSDDELRKLIKWMIDEGKKLKAECEEFEIPFFDTSNDFTSETRKVADYFIQEK